MRLRFAERSKTLAAITLRTRITNLSKTVNKKAHFAVCFFVSDIVLRTVIFSLRESDIAPLAQWYFLLAQKVIFALRAIHWRNLFRLTLLVDRRSLRKIRHCDDDNKLVYCHKSHLNFALLIAPIIFAIISSGYETLAAIPQNYRLDVLPLNKRHS